MIPPGKTEMHQFLVICQGARASWGNQSLESPPQMMQVLRCQSQDNTLVLTMQGEDQET